VTVPVGTGTEREVRHTREVRHAPPARRSLSLLPGARRSDWRRSREATWIVATSTSLRFLRLLTHGRSCGADRPAQDRLKTGGHRPLPQERAWSPESRLRSEGVAGACTGRDVRSRLASRTPDLRITSASYIDNTVHTESIRARRNAHVLTQSHRRTPFEATEGGHDRDQLDNQRSTKPRGPVQNSPMMRAHDHPPPAAGRPPESAGRWPETRLGIAGK
jgi:hypothetical protein